MLWLIARPGAGCWHGEEMGLSRESWRGVELVIVEHERRMGGLLMIVELIAFEVFELMRDEEESVRDKCCLCDADAGAVRLGKLQLLRKKKGLKELDNEESILSWCRAFGITTLRDKENLLESNANVLLNE